MKTYNQQEHAIYFDWNQFFNHTTYTKDDLYMAVTMAMQWTTCACGNQCSVIPRDVNGAPKDSVLSQLGVDFYGCIIQMEQSDTKERLKLYKAFAMETLKKIEKRSEILINELTNHKIEF